jgi:DNA-binding MarR family transcriptional regulator
VIDANPGISQGLAGKALGIQRANMVALINDLVEREFVERQASLSDRRSFELSITSKGKEMLCLCLERVARHEARMLEGFSARDREALSDLLLRIAAREL